MFKRIVLHIIFWLLAGSFLALLVKDRISRVGTELPIVFMRVHRSFLVNTDKIESFTKEVITINAVKVPISRTYKKSVLSG